MNIKLLDTLSGENKLLRAKKGKRLEMFVCGPTVYDVSHIGHGRTYLVFDALARFLRFAGYKVFYLQNITDVDDKIIARASREGVGSLVLANKFTKEYLRDMKSLGVDSVSKYAPATKFIKQIVSQVEVLIKKGFAYEIPGDGFYFDVKAFPDYGKLSRRTAEQAEDSVSRIDQSVNKRNRGDFALWKFSKPGEPMWKTSLGEGRPGWHIEDTAISEYFFGSQYDIHGGGMDLKFPHHEAEIAQQEAASGKSPFVRFWLHAGSLTINGEKMSKSLNNFVTIQDFLKKFSPNVLRLLVLSYHYRSPIDYSEGLASENQRKLDGVAQFLAKLEMPGRREIPQDKEFSIKSFRENFLASLADDFNTARALAEAFRFIGFWQPKVFILSPALAKKIRKAVFESFELLGFTWRAPKISASVAKLAREREKFRGSKQFKQSDLLRKKINDLGYLLEDTPAGPFLWPSKGV